MPTTESKLRGPKGWSFPDDPADIRLALLAKIDGLNETLAAGVAEGEQNSTLASGVVNALYDAGLFAIKLPRELGGAEADLVTQMEVIEALSRIEPSAGWCTMIGATGIGLIGAHLPDEAISQIFPGGSVPRSAGAFMPMGKAETVDGGYLVKDGKTTDEYIRAVFPSSDAVIHDNWDVAGLKGTGSCDFSVSGLFVPQEFTYPRAAAEPKRGGSLYRLGWPGFVAYEHAAFALGVGRRALDVIVAEAGAKIRGMQPSRLASRPSFQKSLGECDLRLKAARTLVIHLLEEAWDQASQGVIPGPQLQGEMRSSATFATSVALDVVTTAFRYGGGSALYTTSVLQRCLRDLNAAAQHLMVSDSAYENHGQFMLDIPDADPMG